MVVILLTTVLDRFNVAYIFLSMLGDELLHNPWDFILLYYLRAIPVGGCHHLPEDIGASVEGMLMTVQGEFQDDLFHIALVEVNR